LKKKLETIRRKISEAAIACGRKPESVRLVAVSKTVPTERVEKAITAGVTLLGENYIQEAIEKHDALSSYKDVEWHFIGHLQTNKAKYAVRFSDLIHSVDSVKLAREINKQAAKLNKIQNILIQVNIGKEATKSGIDEETAETVIREISTLDHIRIKGLMIIPPFYDEPEKVAPYFSALQNLSAQIDRLKIPNVSMKELSMGMSGDFETAIENGATLVRIGTALFGERI